MSLVQRIACLAASTRRRLRRWFAAPVRRPRQAATLPRGCVRTLVVCAIITFFAGVAHAIVPPSVARENLRRGRTDWQLTDPAMQHEIEGYASLTSVPRGGAIDIFVNTSAPTFSLQLFRVGWYQGLGARAVTSRRKVLGVVQTPCTAPRPGLIECAWQPTYHLTIPQTWPSGVYLAKLTAKGAGPEAGKQSYVIFVVRDDVVASPYLVVLPFTTYQAYNNWGGGSYYSYNATVPSGAVSFDRPYGNYVGTRFDTGSPLDPINPNTGLTHIHPDRSIGAGLFFEWDVNFVRWLERAGYNATYATTIDLHERGAALLTGHTALLDLGHDEYWPPDLFDTLRAARDRGMHLGFFGGNDGYHSITLSCADPPGCTRPNRVMTSNVLFDVCLVDGICGATYPLSMCGDRPLTPCTPDCTCVTLGGPGNGGVCAQDLRACQSSAPDCACVDAISFEQPGLRGGLLGVQALMNFVEGDVVIQHTADAAWLFDGTGLQDGQHLPGLLGYETDQLLSSAVGALVDQGIAQYVPIARSPDFAIPGCTPAVPGGCEHWLKLPDRAFAGMAVYTASSGARVFAAGTMQWSWGLDDYTPNVERPTGLVAGFPITLPSKTSCLSAGAQTMMANLLRAFGTPPR